MLAQTSCIIPAYNEEETIGEVLEVVKDFSGFSEIIVVDDGSKDKTCAKVKDFQKKATHIKLLVNKRNLGKTGAILRAVDASKGNLIAMVDSDLINLTHENLEKMLDAIIKEGYSMSILDRAGDRKALWGWTNGARFFGGERAFWKKDFQKLSIEQHAGYLLELKLNLYFIKKKEKIKTIYCKNLYTLHDYNKKGFVDGFNHYRKMASHIIGHMGLSGYLLQIWAIEEDRITPLYLLKDRSLPGKFIAIPLIPIASLCLGAYTFVHLNLQGFGTLPKEKIMRLRQSLWKRFS